MKKIELNDNNLETLMKWCTPRKNYEKWTEDDELLYRKIFDEPYMYLPEEIEEEEKQRNAKILVPLLYRERPPSNDNQVASDIKLHLE